MSGGQGQHNGGLIAGRPVGQPSAVNGKVYRFISLDRCNMCNAGPDRQALIGRRLDRPQGLRPQAKGGITVSIFKCRKCGLVYPNPMPFPDNLEQHYGVAPEEYWTDSYFEVSPDYFAAQIDVFFRLSARRADGMTALDIGAGIGKAMLALERVGFEVHGIEPSPTFRAAAIDRMGASESRLQLASVETAVLPDNYFDFVNFGAVLEHLPDPNQALRQGMKWLKPAGLMYVEVPSSDFLLSRLVPWLYRVTGARGFVVNTSPMHPPYHLFEFGLESFRLHSREEGYAVAFHEYFPCAGYMPRLLVPFFNAVMKWTDTGMQLAVWLKKNH